MKFWITPGKLKRRLVFCLYFQEMATREMSKSSMRMTYTGMGTRDETDSGYQVRRTEDVFHQQVNERVMNGIFSSKHFLVWC